MFSKFIRRFCTKIIKEQNKKESNKHAELISKITGKKSVTYIKVRDPPRKINVSLQGANCKAGLSAALLLKQHPLIKKIYMYDSKLNSGIGRDINCVDSSAKIETYCGDTMEYSLRAADIVVLLDTERQEPSFEKKFESSYYRVHKFAHMCKLHCPKAVVIICVEPLIPMVSFVQCILEETPFYHPSRLIGNVSSVQSQVNTVTSQYFSLDPRTVHVPLLGGTDIQTAVPLISLMTPNLYLSPADQSIFYKMLKEELGKSENDICSKISTMNDGYNIGKIVITIAKGLNGHDDALASGLARTNQTYPLKYLVTTLKFGLGGIYHNYGIPKLSVHELENLEQALLSLEKREECINKLFEHQTKILQSNCG